MPAAIIPWMPSNVPLEIQQELDRRKKVKNFNYVSNQKAGWNDKNGDWSSYKGPMTQWVRMCSNSAGHPSINKPRFVFYGGKNFYDTYGFTPMRFVGKDVQVIGYTPTNPPRPHTINNSLNITTGGTGQYPIHVPTPEISKLTVTVQKELFRRAEVEWTCFSWEQLVYMTPYFLIPGISVMLEFGWNHFDPASLVKLDDENEMFRLWRNAYPLYVENVIKSRGNYDVLYGIITNFNWSMEGNRITCMTEITSKDRLYAGISKDMGLTVNDKSDTDTDEPRPIFQSLRDFISKNSTLLNIKSIAESEPGTEVTKLSGGNVPISGSIKGSENQNINQNIIWRDILRPILSEPRKEIRAMKVPYIHGIFSGRPMKFYNDPIGLGKPHANDFDKSNVDNLDPKKVWINMGLIVEILNYFSGLDGGKGEPMFQVDIMNTVIGGHPNMMSCNREVLIPNAGAPKAHLGSVGWEKYGYEKIGIVGGAINASGESTEGSSYKKQVKTPTEVKTPSDKILRRVCYQSLPESHGKVCYRNNIDRPINFLRYKFRSSPERGSEYKGHSNYQNFFAFPAIEDLQLPVSNTGLGSPTSKLPNSPSGNYVESGVSGLLSDIYLSYSAFQMAIKDPDPDPKNASYVDIYRKILSILNDAVDGFWDLVLVEADNIMTITDKNYLSTQSRLGQDTNPTYTFDYFDTDSIIKSIRFRPALSDAQATRAIYGETNNAQSKYVYVDKNDLLDYKFKDAIILNKDERKQGDPQGNLEKRTTEKQQFKDILGVVQKLNTSEDDDTLQMTINSGGTTSRAIGSGTTLGISTSNISQETENGPFEYLKLCLPSSVGKQIFRLLVNDKDEENNPRYCAMQPGITLELTIQGCGGLRTFQYFLVKNLPEPYSHKNIIFRIIDVKHLLSQEGNGWDTVITAGILPLRKYIKKRLAPPVGGWAP